MIPRHTDILIQHLDPAALVVDPADHAEPVDDWAVQHYTRLLTEQPDADTDPLLVVDRGGRLCVRRGRHRYLANVAVGRPYVLAMVYDEVQG